jgi:hypothetical protein
MRGAYGKANGTAARGHRPTHVHVKEQHVNAVRHLESPVIVERSERLCELLRSTPSVEQQVAIRLGCQSPIFSWSLTAEQHTGLHIYHVSV